MAANKIISGRNYGSLTLNTLTCTRLVLVSIGYGSSGFTDAQNGSGWQALTQQNASDGTQMQMHYHEAPAVHASHVFTHPQTYGTLAVIGFTGWAASSAFNGQNGSALGSNGLTIQPGAVTPSENGCVLVAAIGTSGDPTGSAPAGWTVAESLAGLGGTNYGVALAFLIQGTAGAENPTFAHTPTGLAAAVIAAFKSDGIGGGGGGGQPPRSAFINRLRRAA